MSIRPGELIHTATRLLEAGKAESLEEAMDQVLSAFNKAKNAAAEEEEETEESGPEGAISEFESNF